MEISAAWLLTVFLAVITVTHGAFNTTTVSPSSTTESTKEVNTTTSKNEFIDLGSKIYARPFANMKDILMQEIRTLDKDVTDAQIQEELAETLKAEAQRDRANLRTETTAASNTSTTEKAKSAKMEIEELKKFDETSYEDDLSDGTKDDDLYDDDDEDEDMEDEIDDDEEVVMPCPHFCKCAGQYAAVMTATCNKLVDEQSFGSGIAHLRIEHAGHIRLGPNALRARGLQQLESITIFNTTIVELDRTAFNGIEFLFAVNLTLNNLTDIHLNTFQNNTQLSLLTIANNRINELKPTRHYLLNAPFITDLDLSSNGITSLKRTSFSKMRGLNYINLRNNKLRQIDNAIFDSLKALIEVDLSDNSLYELDPFDLFTNSEIETLRLAGNNLQTLANVNASKLTTLVASRNKIRTIARDDLQKVPLLEQLNVRSNYMKRIHQHAFSDLNQLQHLDISDNRLTSLTEHHFMDNPRLQVLLMSDNPDLKTLPVFKTYGLEYNTFSVYRFECANCGLDSLALGTFDEMPALTQLNLARNRLNGLPAGLLDSLSALRELDLSNNNIFTLEPDMFRGAQSLNKLSLAYNPLSTLQVTPFLNTPALTKLNVSHCYLERVWSEARMPLKSLRFLSVRHNLLRRITVEELRATPRLTGLDLRENDLICDTEFTEAVQWLTDYGVAPSETHKYINDFDKDDDDADFTGISQWTEFAKSVCGGVPNGPPPRRPPGKSSAHPKDRILTVSDMPEDISDFLLTNELDKEEKLLKLDFDHGMRHVDEPRLLDEQEYDGDFAITTEYHSWYTPTFKIWLISGTIFSVLIVFLLVTRLACHLANKRGRGPVLRPPMILRPGLIDNKNCGLVYKPLQEEIATPHMPKRGSFYSSSTFHYDKIVPESV